MSAPDSVLIAAVERRHALRLQARQTRVQLDGDLVKVVLVQRVAQPAYRVAETFERVLLKAEIARHLGYVLVEPFGALWRSAVRVSRYENDQNRVGFDLSHHESINQHYI